MTTETINVPDISCSNCKSSIEGAVAQLDGIDLVVVDIEATQVAVSYDTDRLDRSAIVDAIEGQGYNVATG